MRKYKVLQRRGEKVLIAWETEKCSFFPNGVEYSVHTCLNDEFYWGHYFTDKDDAIEYFDSVTGNKM